MYDTFIFFSFCLVICLPSMRPRRMRWTCRVVEYVSPRRICPAMINARLNAVRYESTPSREYPMPGFLIPAPQFDGEMTSRKRVVELYIRSSFGSPIGDDISKSNDEQTCKCYRFSAIEPLTYGKTKIKFSKCIGK